MIPLRDNYNTKHKIPKPEFSYKVGQHLCVDAHIPPRPTRSDCCLKYAGHRERESVDILARCFRHPPLPGVFTFGAAELEVVNLVRAGDGHGAQLLVVRVLQSNVATNLPQNLELLAKLYDPLYSDHEQDDADPFKVADRAYSHESAVYAKLSNLQGGIIPKFYGSFSLSLSIDTGQGSGSSSREVRLILIEYVPGVRMQELIPLDFTQSERQGLLKLIVDAETTLHNRDVRHRDIHPRNILVLYPPFLKQPSDSNTNSAKRKLVLMDFGISWPSRCFPCPHLEEAFLPGVPISPILRWSKPRGEFDGWIDWDFKSWIEHTYEDTKDSITEYMRKRWNQPV